MAWLQLLLDVDAESVPLVSEALTGAGALAVTLEDAADRPLYEPPLDTMPLWPDTRVVGLFDAGADADAILLRVRTGLGEAPMPPCRFQVLKDQEWSRAWMDDFKPMRFGDRLWVCPTWSEPPDADAVNLILDPGLAFGTGTHPTTALCLEWLDRYPPHGLLVLDYGCGSGILGIAAARLGARHVWFVDIDPQALEATTVNAARNGVPARDCYTALPEEVPPLQADLLLANILAEPLVRLAPEFRDRVRPGGRIVLSGILADQTEAVARAYGNGFTMETPVLKGEWARLCGTRAG